MPELEPPTVVDAITFLLTVRGLTQQARSLAQLVDQLTQLLPKATQDIDALTTAIVGFGDLVEHLQRRIDRLERQALPAVGRVQ